MVITVIVLSYYGNGRKEVVTIEKKEKKKIIVPKIEFDMEAIQEIKNRKKKVGKSSNPRKEVTQ